MTMTTILCLSKETRTRKLIQHGLEGYGYKVITALQDEDAITLAAKTNPDCIVLAVNLESPQNGIEVCRRLREWCTTPIIVLSSCQQKAIKIAALNAGADDYVIAPFDMEEFE